MSNGPDRDNRKTVACLGGAGGMGITLARQLCQSDRIAKLIVADLDGKAAARVADDLRVSATCEVAAQEVDVLRRNDLGKFLQEVDFVANTAGPFFKLGVPTLETAIETRTPYLDICDDPEPTIEMVALNKRAEAAGVGAVIGMGASPGLSNLMARRAADRLDEVIDCYTAWPLDVNMPGEKESPLEGEAGSEVSAAVVHLMEQISGTIDNVVDGQLTRVPPLQQVTLDYPGLGVGTGITVGHPEPVTLFGSLKIQGRATNLMLTQRSTEQYLKLLARDIDHGVLTLNKAAEEVLKPKALRTVGASLRSFRSKGPGKLPAFFVLLVGLKDGKQRTVGCHATTLPTGMDGATSIPAALAIEILLECPAPPGVHAPETAIDPDRLLDALRSHCPGSPATIDDLAPISESANA